MSRIPEVNHPHHPVAPHPSVSASTFYAIEYNPCSLKGPHSIVCLNSDAVVVRARNSFGTLGLEMESKWLKWLGQPLAALLGLDTSMEWNLKGLPKAYSFYLTFRANGLPSEKLRGPARIGTGGKKLFFSPSHFLLHLYWLCLFPSSERQHCRCALCLQVSQTLTTRRLKELLGSELVHDLSSDPLQRYKMIVRCLKLPAVEVEVKPSMEAKPTDVTQSKRIDSSPKPEDRAQPKRIDTSDKPKFMQSSLMLMPKSEEELRVDYDRMPQEVNTFKDHELVWYRLFFPFRQVRAAKNELPEIAITHWPALVNPDQCLNKRKRNSGYVSIRLIGVASKLEWVQINRLTGWQFYDPLPVMSKFWLPERVDLKRNIAGFENFEDAFRSFGFAIIIAGYLAKMISIRATSTESVKSATIRRTYESFWLGPEKISVGDYVLLGGEQVVQQEMLRVLLVHEISCSTRPPNELGDTTLYQLKGDTFDVLVQKATGKGNRRGYSFLLGVKKLSNTKVAIKDIVCRMYSIQQINLMDFIKPPELLTIQPPHHEEDCADYINVDGRLDAFQAAIDWTIKKYDRTKEIENSDH